MAAPPEEQTKILENLRQLFVAQDGGKKGFFTLEEWTQACATFFENGNPDDHAAESFKRLDLDGTGQLDYNNLLRSFEDQLKDNTTNAVDLLLNVITHGPASQQNAAAKVGKKRGKTQRKGRKKGVKRKSKTAKKSKAAARIESKGYKVGTKKGRKSKRKKKSSESQSNLPEEELSVSVSVPYSLPHNDAAPIAMDDPAVPLPPPEPGPFTALPSDYKVWGPPSTWNFSCTQSWKRAELKDKWLTKLQGYDTPSSLQHLTPGKLKAAGFKMLKVRKAIIKKIRVLQNLEKELNPSSPVRAAGYVANGDMGLDGMGLKRGVSAPELPSRQDDPRPLEIYSAPVSGKRKKGRLKRSKSVIKSRGGRGRTTKKKSRKGKKGRKSGVVSAAASPMGVKAPPPMPAGNVVSWATQDIEDWARGFMKPKSAFNFANKIGTGEALLKLNLTKLKKLKLFKTKSGRKKVIDNVRSLLRAASQPAPSLPQGAAGLLGLPQGAVGLLDEQMEEDNLTPSYIPLTPRVNERHVNIDAQEAGSANYDSNRKPEPTGESFGLEEALSLSPSSPAPPSSAPQANAMQQPSQAPAPGAQLRGVVPYSAPEPMSSTTAPNEDNDAPPASPDAPPSHAHLTHAQEQPEVFNAADSQPLDLDGDAAAPVLDEQGQPPDAASDLPLESEFDSPELQSMFQMFLNMDVEGKGYLVLDQWIDACNKLFDREGESYAPISFGRLALNDRLDYAQLLISIERTVQQAEGELNPLDVFTNLVLTEKEEDVDYQQDGLDEYYSGDEVGPMNARELEEHEKRLHYIIVNVFGDVQEDHQYSYDAFKEKIKQLMPDYEEEEYRQLFDSLDHGQSGYILHRDVVAMVSNFMAQMEMGEESSDEAGREPPAHFQDGGDQEPSPVGADILDYGSYPEPSESMIDSSERMKAAEARAAELAAGLNPEIMEIAVGQNEV